MSKTADFKINSKGVLTAYTGNAEIVEIPSGVKKIGRNVFSGCKNLIKISIPEGVTEIDDHSFFMAGMEAVLLPDSLEKIGNGAFKYCENLQEINLPLIEVLEIGENAFTGCKKLVDEEGFFILQDRLFTYYVDNRDKIKVLIPERVRVIEDDAFDEFKRIDLEMPIKCPVWSTSGAAKRYGLARSVINRDGSTISFKDESGSIISKIILATKDETEPKKNTCILAIKCKEKGGFDFESYDSCFAKLSKISNKIRMAMIRLQYPYELSDEMQTVYYKFLKRHAEKAGMILIDENDEDGIRFLGEKQIINQLACHKLIDHARLKDNVAITAWLLEYNNASFDKMPKSKTKLALRIPELISTEIEKTVDDWRKIFKFKYKEGGIIINKYLGEEESVSFPEKIGNKYVIGIGFMTFCFDTSKKVKKIIIPGWITSIEEGAFFCIENVEVEIQEGIEELPDNIFRVASNLTVKLPNSLKKIGKLFGDSDSHEDNIKIYVPTGSAAEEFCIKHKWNYSRYNPEKSKSERNVTEVKMKIKEQKLNRNEDTNIVPWKKPKAGSQFVPRYQGNETSVLFPTKVEGISISGIANTAGETPDNYKQIKEVILPEGYKYIGNKAFAGCENLEIISLPSTIKEIGSGAFAGCKSLKEIVIKKNISFVGKNVFANSNINVVVIETDNKTKIPAHMFFGCHIKSLVVYGGPFKSNGNVFDYTGVSSVVEYAEDLYEGNFPEAVYINEDFSTLDLKGIGGGNAKKVHPLAEFDESIIINEPTRIIIAAEKAKTERVVNNAGKVTETTEVESIDFRNCIFVLSGFNRGEEYIIHSEIEQRGGTIKSEVSVSVNYIVTPNRRIVKNSKIKKAEELRAKGKSISIIQVSECRRHMRIHDERLFGADGAKVASDFRVSIDDGKVTLQKYVGADTDVIIPDTIGSFPIVALGKNCFAYHSEKIHSVTIPASITVIPEGVFNYCSELSRVNLSEGLLCISNRAFEECNCLEEISIPNTVTTIEESAFIGCENLKKVHIPASVTKITSPFFGCNNLSEITVDRDNKKYDSRDNCNAIIETATNTLVVGCKNTFIPGSVKSIGDYAYGGIDSISELSIPEGVIEIGNGAFNGCMEMKALKLAHSIKKIGEYAFYFCRNLTRMELPANLEEIPITAFEQCEKLTEIVVGDALKEISDVDSGYHIYFKTVYGSEKSIAKSVAEELKCKYVEI